MGATPSRTLQDIVRGLPEFGVRPAIVAYTAGAARANRTQFMIVTHNQTVIERADKLVGVTQEEKGISKLVAVNLHEALQQAKTVEEAAQA